MLKTQIQEIEPNKVMLTIEVDKEVVASAYQNFFQKAARTVSIPGFRRGKIPRPVLINFLGPDSIKEEISNDLIQKAYPQACKDENLHPVSPLKVEETILKEGEPFTFKATVEIRPTVPDFTYSGRKVTVKRAIVDDESVNKVLQTLREDSGKLVPVENGTLDYNDYFSGKIEVKVDGVIDSELSEEKTYKKFVPGNKFLDFIRGMKAGETRNQTHEIKNEADKDSVYFGKTLEYSVQIDQISRLVLSDLNDDFARDLGDFKSLDDLKAKIRNDLEARYKADADSRAINQILIDISKETPFSLPESMIEHAIDIIIQTLDKRWRQMGTSVEEFLKRSEKKIDEFRQGFREQAILETKVMMIVDAIAERAKIEVLEAEFRKEIEKKANAYGIPVEKLMEHLSQQDGEKNIKISLIRQKVEDFLLKNNEIHYDMVNEQDIDKGDPQGDSGTHSN